MRIPQEHKEQINSTFSENAVKMMKKRYLLPYDEGGQEMPADMFERVANALASVEKDYEHDEEFIERTARDFFAIMANKEYTPAGRTLTRSRLPHHPQDLAGMNIEADIIDSLHKKLQLGLNEK